VILAARGLERLGREGVPAARPLLAPVVLGAIGLLPGMPLLAFGGGNTILPEMQRQVVEVQNWMSAREFASLYALAQAAPGPNLLVSSLIGWRVAGLSGALVATLAVCVPAGLLTYFVAAAWQRGVAALEPGLARGAAQRGRLDGQARIGNVGAAFDAGAVFPGVDAPQRALARLRRARQRIPHRWPFGARRLSAEPDIGRSDSSRRVRHA